MKLSTQAQLCILITRESFGDVIGQVVEFLISRHNRHTFRSILSSLKQKLKKKQVDLDLLFNIRFSQVVGHEECHVHLAW